MQPIKVCESAWVEIPVREGGMVSRITVRSVDPDSNLAVLPVVYERIDPFPHHLAGTCRLEQSATGSLAYQNRPRPQTFRAGDVVAEKLVHGFTLEGPGDIAGTDLDLDDSTCRTAVVEDLNVIIINPGDMMLPNSVGELQLECSRLAINHAHSIVCPS